MKTTYYPKGTHTCTLWSVHHLPQKLAPWESLLSGCLLSSEADLRELVTDSCGGCVLLHIGIGRCQAPKGGVFILCTAGVLQGAVCWTWCLDGPCLPLRPYLVFVSPSPPSDWPTFPLIMSTLSIRPQIVSSGNLVHF